MNRDYELFERRSDGVLSWRGVVQGLTNARVTVRLLADETGHECFAMHLPDKEIVARVMPPRASDDHWPELFTED
jgi:hypothetical protein